MCLIPCSLLPCPQLYCIWLCPKKHLNKLSRAPEQTQPSVHPFEKESADAEFQGRLCVGCAEDDAGGSCRRERDAGRSNCASREVGTFDREARKTARRVVGQRMVGPPVAPVTPQKNTPSRRGAPEGPEVAKPSSVRSVSTCFPKGEGRKSIFGSIFEHPSDVAVSTQRTQRG